MAPGTTLGGRYRLGRRLAAGGMGSVWEAEDALLGRPVAVKVPAPWLLQDERFRERFRREALAAAGLAHPNVAAVLDYGEDETPYLVMELLAGETLAERLRRGPLPWGEAVRIATEVAEALEAAHRAGVVHRDVKPANVMLTRDGGVKVMDFGIAAAAWAPTITASGVALGTATYVSPEQASGARVTPASDVYSLGVVLYEMLAGRPPFVAETAVAVATLHVTTQPPPLLELAPHVPEELVDVIARALAKDPSRRPPTGGALAALLRTVAAPTEPLPAPGPVPGAPLPPGEAGHGRARTLPPPDTAVLPSPVLRRPAGRGRGGAPAAVAALAALAVLGGVLARSLDPGAPPARSPTRRVPPTAATAAPAGVAVPDVVGMPLDQAVAALLGRGLFLGGVELQEGPAGLVVETDPEVGETVDPGTPVTLYVGTGPDRGRGPAGGKPEDGGKGRGEPGNERGREGD